MGIKFFSISHSIKEVDFGNSPISLSFKTLCLDFVKYNINKKWGKYDNNSLYKGNILNYLDKDVFFAS